MSGRVTTRYASSTRYSFPNKLIVQFFLNFCQAAFVFTAFVFATLVVYTVRMNGSSSDLDPQMIVIIALYVWKITHLSDFGRNSHTIYRAGLFALFTSTLVVSHVNMILKGQTTVESMSIRSMRERESATLQRAYSWWEFGYVLCSATFSLPFTIFFPSHDTLFPSSLVIAAHDPDAYHPFSSFTFTLLISAHQSVPRSARRRTLKEWDHEWGALSTEGNIWWMGSRSKEWFSVMGSNALGWICECFAIILCFFSCLPPPRSSLILLMSASSGSRERTLDGRRPDDYFASQSALVRAPMRS